MASFCIRFIHICSIDFDSGKDRNRGREFQSCNRPENHGCGNHGLGMVFLTNSQGGIASISKKSWIFLILSGIATGISWLCYYRALQIGEASKVVPIDKLSVVITIILAFVFLHESITVKSIIGMILITAGTLFMVL